MEELVFHIVGRDDWIDAKERGRYAPDAFAADGFIHLSKKSQILHPANLFYRGRTDLQLLVIAADRVRADIVYEPGSHGEEELFPHLYGQLNLDAVIDVVDFPCNEDGSFDEPKGLRA
jgi:uncharacterized protein (DUF952 family)